MKRGEKSKYMAIFVFKGKAEVTFLALLNLWKLTLTDK